MLSLGLAQPPLPSPPAMASSTSAVSTHPLTIPVPIIGTWTEDLGVESA